MKDTSTNFTIERVKKPETVTVGDIPEGIFFTGRFDKDDPLIDYLFLRVEEDVVSFEAQGGVILLECEADQAVYNYYPRRVRIVVEE